MQILQGEEEDCGGSGPPSSVQSWNPRPAVAHHHRHHHIIIIVDNKNPAKKTQIQPSREESDHPD